MASNLGLVVSGGPAPGINGVISAATIEARNRGIGVKGCVGGFKGLVEKGRDSLVDLEINDVAQIYNWGGSILGTARFNPLLTEQDQQKLRSTLNDNQIDKLIVIGGEGSSYLSSLISRCMPELSIIHVPKTIDNDLILPNNYPSFGFETARYAGAKILDTLAVDARTCRRWFLVTTMGRRAGFLALGLGIASGAHLTIIPEDFAGRKISLNSLAEQIVACMQLRASQSKPFGVVIVAEGLLDCIDPSSSPELLTCPRDELGRIKYSQLELHDVLLPAIQRILGERNLALNVTGKNMGYELRCHAPISFDIEYTKFLGVGAVELLAQGKRNCMIVRNADSIGEVDLNSLIDSQGKIRSRVVDIKSDLYRIAHRLMISG